MPDKILTTSTFDSQLDEISKSSVVFAEKFNSPIRKCLTSEEIFSQGGIPKYNSESLRLNTSASFNDAPYSIHVATSSNQIIGTLASNSTILSYKIIVNSNEYELTKPDTSYNFKCNGTAIKATQSKTKINDDLSCQGYDDSSQGIKIKIYSNTPGIIYTSGLTYGSSCLLLYLLINSLNRGPSIKKTLSPYVIYSPSCNKFNSGGFDEIKNDTTAIFQTSNSLIFEGGEGYKTNSILLNYYADNNDINTKLSNYATYKGAPSETAKTFRPSSAWLKKLLESNDQNNFIKTSLGIN